MITREPISSMKALVTVLMACCNSTNKNSRFKIREVLISFSMMFPNFINTLTLCQTLALLCKICNFKHNSYNPYIQGYEPKGREWIKGQIFNGLKR